MTPDDMSRYELIIAIIAVVNICITIAVFWGNRSKAASSRLDDMQTDVEAKLDRLGRELREAVTGHSMRLERLDTHISRMPSHSDLSQIYEQVNAVREKVSSVQGQLTGITDNLRLITNKLLDE
ncbi:MAG: DUF2730 family protein [Proteobacteria bacterium]|nr:DUF2730 family protein [Pseudomonadota bacterium]